MPAWTPLLLLALFSAIAVLFASSLIHRVVRWHDPDYRGFLNEDEVRAAITRTAPRPSPYVLPYCFDHKPMADPEVWAKHEGRPWSATARYMVVGLICTALTGGLCAALWPTVS